MINFLQAADVVVEQPQQPANYSLFIMIGLMILVLWLFMWRPESKRRKQMAQFRAGLKKGDKVVTAGGIYGCLLYTSELRARGNGGRGRAGSPAAPPCR